MGVGPGVLVGPIDVGRMVVDRIHGLVHPVLIGARVRELDQFAGVAGVGEARPAVGVAALVDPVGVIGLDRQVLQRGQGEFRRIGEIGAPLEVDVVALVDDDVAAVVDLVVGPAGQIDPGAVGILRGEAGHRMAAAGGEGILRIRDAREVVGGCIEGRVVAQPRPLVDPEVDLRAEVVLVKHVGTDVHHAFLAVIGR